MNAIKLWDKKLDSTDGFEPYIESYLLDDGKIHGAVIICPGGGYSRRAEHEGKPIAELMNSEGLNAFVLQYRVNPNLWPAPQQDAARAIRIIRSNAKKYNIDPDKIAILGFSAGGHLAASLSVYFDTKHTKGDDKMDAVSCRPDAVIACYPVISADSEFAHMGSVTNLLGKNPPEEKIDIFSLEKHVRVDMPPIFMWHTAEDRVVPAMNSLIFAQALAKQNINYELHIFPEGGHGLGIKRDVPYILIWTDLTTRWLRQMDW